MCCHAPPERSAFASLTYGDVTWLALSAKMNPVVVGLAHDAGPGGSVPRWALALDADLGGNATAVGASAIVVALGIAERSGHLISLRECCRGGLLVTVVTVGLAVPYLWLRYLLPSRPGAPPDYHAADQPAPGEVPAGRLY